MAKRGPSVTKAQIARALSVARDAWGDDARVTIHPDKDNHDRSRRGAGAPGA
jgi:hypothetical protein